MAEPLTADEVIAHLKLAPHPEGGWYRETFRDESGHAGRPHSTAILFLLKAGEVSRWHRVDVVEMWHWYGGAPLMLEVADEETGTRHEYKLGPDIIAGEHPQGMVPARAWQSARSLGAWSLVGCTVAPGFDFAGFELAPQGWEP
jgi:predicted cupin superfamily sugar epimerase